ncbi:GNAT family N-acetyltransferase [Ktedonospora formicarum]|uniref:Ribosomal-protein-serine acetyltransferase n=1 Tax=Ktedonospora formicarum TaxID=2778364 RepID=A0A8J3I696_9CHLR|nr:GNAT family protein [Ktedonospora formicarum]GHO49416.1 ribosomal-protein-serine acetyltransferase [Ktedonospora formicarum]
MSILAYRSLTPLFDELHDDRIIVRPYRKSDAQALFDAVNESREHLRPWLPFADKHQTIEETLNWINVVRARWVMREDINLSIWERESGRFLGGTGLHPRTWEIGYFEIGYWLSASAEGHGYLSAGLKLLIEFAFTSLKVQRLEIRCDARNVRSASVAHRLGFTQEGHLRHDGSTPDGSLRNTLIFGLLAEEYASTSKIAR